MLNCFYWYAAVWIIVLLLYSMNISSFSMPLNAATIIFFVVSIIVSLVFGTVFRKNFRFRSHKVSEEPNSTPLFFILGLFVLDILYARELPLLSVVIHRTSVYGNFNPIPIVHIAIIGLATYFAQKYFYIGLCNRQYRKKMWIYYLILILIFLGYFLRSQIMYNLFMSGILTLEYIRQNKVIKPKHVLITIAGILLVLYGFGGLGNLRVSGQWNNSTYIDIVGKFNVDLDIVPKQFMWPYLYMISPLTNLNYNVVNNTGGFDIIKYVAEFMPETISKRVGIERAQTLLYQPYFTVSTGFCRPYITFGIIGMLFFFMFVAVIILIGTQHAVKGQNDEKITIYNAASCMIMFFMFFTNTIFENGTSWVFVIAFASLFINIGHTRYRLVINRRQTNAIKKDL